MGKLTKHIIRNGSREHVVSWIATVDGCIRQCSCPTCEINAGREALSKAKEADGDQPS